MRVGVIGLGGVIETWVSLCKLMLKLRGISHSSDILGSDSNNSKGLLNLFIPSEPHSIAGCFKATTANTNACTDAGAVVATLSNGGTRVRHL